MQGIDERPRSLALTPDLQPPALHHTDTPQLEPRKYIFGLGRSLVLARPSLLDSFSGIRSLSIDV